MISAIFTTYVAPAARSDARIKVEAEGLPRRFYPMNQHVESSDAHFEAALTFIKELNLNVFIAQSVSAKQLNNSGYVYIAEKC